jgi:hypothetical protein
MFLRASSVPRSSAYPLGGTFGPRPSVIQVGALADSSRHDPSHTRRSTISCSVRTDEVMIASARRA